jgi:hypothetical protein
VAPGGGVRLSMPASGTPTTTSLALDADGDGAYKGTVAPGLQVTNTTGRIPVPVPNPSAIAMTVPTGQMASQEMDFPDVEAAGWTWSLAETVPWLASTAAVGAAPGSVTLTVDASALAEGAYEASIAVILRNGAFERALTLPVRLTVTAPVSGEASPAPTVTRLLAPAPNPTVLRATLRAELGQAGPMTIEIVDALGRTVLRLADGLRDAGAYTFEIDARSMPSGVYVVRMQTAEGSATQRLTVVR